MGRFDCHSLSKKGCLWLKILKIELKRPVSPFAVCLLYLQKIFLIFSPISPPSFCLCDMLYLGLLKDFLPPGKFPLFGYVLIIFYLAAGVSLTAVAETLDQENRKSFSALLPSTSSLTRGIINSFRTSVIRSMTCSTILVYHSGVSC